MVSATIRVAKPPHSGAGWRIVGLFLFLLAGDANATLRRDEGNDLIATLAFLIDDDFDVFHNVFRVVIKLTEHPNDFFSAGSDWRTNDRAGGNLTPTHTQLVVLFLRRGDKSLFIDFHDDAMDCQP